MGRHVGRSRGCKICIQRRIKCDESLPECSECLKSGRNCPGPLKGTLFVDMSVRARNGVKESRLTDTPDLKQPKLSSTPPDTETTQDLTPPAKYSESENISLQLRLPSTYQPNRTDIFQELYISYLVSSHDTLLHAWIPHLPDMLTCPQIPNFSIGVYGIRATSMALYGKLTSNKDLEIEAAKWYSKGLGAQRKRLLQLSTTDWYDADAANDTICSAIVFSFFESILATTPISWLQHVNAAGRMLEMGGPERCQTGLMHMYFLSVRLASVFTSVILEKPSIFASKPWCTIPFQQNPKRPLDTLLDIMLQLPTCLLYRNEMLKLRSANPTTSNAANRKLTTTLQYLLHRLDHFWSKEKLEIDPHYDLRIETQTYSRPYNSITFESPFAATLTSLYDAASIIVLTCLAPTSCTPETHNWKATIHAGSILSSIAYHESQGPLSGGSFSMIFPIRVVSLRSPSGEQRVIAHEAMVRWGRGRGLDGVGITRVTAPEDGGVY